MKAKLRLNQDADLDTVTDAYKVKLQFEKRHGKMVAYYPKGTEFEGEHALALVLNGQADPSDAECAEAAGMKPEQLEVVQRKYLAASRGIKGKKDFEMFMAGAIEGYTPESTDEHVIYEKGPNWDAWQLAEQQAKAEITKDTI